MVGWIAVVWVVIICFLLMLPQFGPIGPQHLQLRLVAVARGHRLRRDLLAGLRSQLVQRAEGPGHGGGTGRDRATSSRRCRRDDRRTRAPCRARAAAGAACSRLSSCASSVGSRARSTRSCSPSPTCRGACRASACPPSSSSTRSSSTTTEGCNYLLAVDVEMNTVDGYAMSSWERGYGDFVMRPDAVHAAAGAVARGHGAAHRATSRWPTGARWSPRPARSCRRRSSRLAKTRLDRAGRHRAGVHRLSATASSRHWPAVARPDPRQPVQRRLLHPRHQPGRAVAAARSGYGMAGAGMHVESAKGECNLGQHEIAFRYADALDHLRQPLHLQDRGEGDRRRRRA